MVTLSWTKLNPTIKLVDTKKAFFGQYLYKLIVRVPAGRLLQDSSGSAMTYLLNRRLQYSDVKKSYNYAGSWLQTRINRKLEGASVNQLEYYRNIYDNNSNVKVRIEEPYISLYSRSEDELFQIAKFDVADRLIELHGPNNHTARSALERGEVIVKRPTDYSYKVVLKESSKFDSAVRNSVYNYLLRLGDEVKMTKSCQINLTKKNLWFTQCYFYIKDIEVVTFLTLMAPNAVAGIYKLTYIK